ncbi:amidohydrolase family protein [Sinomonas sp. JGH33]|uniref:Amidohydrolase family protein n=1 Tax=Sinomonas terricola TaxID=3110330 RepID=A0ABU5T449_9MICC|nr:amidohydrolase family protein [Sinomonas sp. JGH33]MEA5454440.1 amidohydrolase family protein [Sinomonas sp. JGH33]
MKESGTSSERALTLYRNGSVYSTADPLASAMLVDGDTVAWVGTEHAAESIAGAGMTIVDLDGALVTPGFVDSHVHLSDTGLALQSLDLSGVRSARELLEAMSAAPTAEGILRGHSWDESLWDDPALPTAQELRRAAGGREAFLTRVDVHSALVTGGLAEAAGATRLEGWSDGPAVSQAALVSIREAARPSHPEELRSLHRVALDHAASRGYVALVEQAAPHIGGIDDLRLLLGGEHGDEARPQVMAYWGQLISSAAEGKALLAELGVPVLGLAGDLNIDGSLGSRTAFLTEEYDDAAGHRGVAYLDAEQVARHLAACSELGIQGGFHVIGDGGLEIALEGLRRASERVGASAIRAAGHRLEHAEMASATAIAALAGYAVTVSAQPLFDTAWGAPGHLYERRLGQRRIGMNPLASFASAGVPVCFGSDSPVCALDPWASVAACLRHSTPSERISARAAFIGHTRAGWRAVHHPHPLMGQLVPGAPASFAVWEVDELMVQVADERVQAWSTDPRARTPLLPALDTENRPRCLSTVHRGVELFRAEGFAA